MERPADPMSAPQKPTNDRILLECPACRRTVQTPRQPEDPLHAVKMTNYCECTQGFDDVHYYDASGEEISLE